MRTTVLGAGIGLAASLLLTRFMRALLFEVSANDPVIYAGVAALLPCVAAVAAWIPARRASRVNSMVALRFD